MSAKPYTRKWVLTSPNKKYKNQWSDKVDGSKKWHGLGTEVWQYSYRMSFSKRASRGDWTMRVFHDGKLAKTIKVTVADKKPPNRPPSKAAGGRFKPRKPRVFEALACVVDFPHSYPDPDLDFVRYRYEWRLNSEVVRRSTQGTRVDYLPARRARPGDQVQCEVFVTDGKKESAPLLVEGRF